MVRDMYANLLPAIPERAIDPGDTILTELASIRCDRRLQTPEIAQPLATTLREIWPRRATGTNADELLPEALSKSQSLAQRIGDDSNLALDPDLDSYYFQNIVVRRMPNFLGQLTNLQQLFETTMSGDTSSVVRQVRLPANNSLLRPPLTTQPRLERPQDLLVFRLDQRETRVDNPEIQNRLWV